MSIVVLASFLGSPLERGYCSTVCMHWGMVHTVLPRSSRMLSEMSKWVRGLLELFLRATVSLMRFSLWMEEGTKMESETCCSWSHTVG